MRPYAKQLGRDFFEALLAKDNARIVQCLNANRYLVYDVNYVGQKRSTLC